MRKCDKVYVAGHTGLLGSAVLRALRQAGHEEVVVRTRQQLDLCNQRAVAAFFEEEQPAFVFLVAARVGGIWANMRFPAEFIRQNLLIELNVVHSAWACGSVRKLLFVGSSCVYPKQAPQPMPESCLLSGPLEPTNEAYALAKIAGIKMCQAYRAQYGFNAITCMPTNLYGPHDNFDPSTSHVLPALLQKCHHAARSGEPVVVWGTGNARREFLHVDDCAAALLFLMQHYDEAEIVNVGVGSDVTIKELVLLLAEVVGGNVSIAYDESKPDGTPRKLLDVSRINDLGWKANIPLRQGVQQTYQWWLQHSSESKAGNLDSNDDDDDNNNDSDDQDDARK